MKRTIVGMTIELIGRRLSIIYQGLPPLSLNNNMPILSWFSLGEYIGSYTLTLKQSPLLQSINSSDHRELTIDSA